MYNALNYGAPIRLVQLNANPAGENGGIYYNDISHVIRSFQDGSWEDLATVSFVNSIASGLDPKESVEQPLQPHFPPILRREPVSVLRLQ